MKKQPVRRQFEICSLTIVAFGPNPPKKLIQPSRGKAALNIHDAREANCPTPAGIANDANSYAETPSEKATTYPSEAIANVQHIAAKAYRRRKCIQIAIVGKNDAMMSV
jgi:hypothetical protein